MKELRECTKLGAAACVVDPGELDLGRTAASKEEIKTGRVAKRMDKLLSTVSKNFESATSAQRRLCLKFLSNPVEFVGDDANNVTAVRVERTRLEGEAGSQRAVGTGEKNDLPAGLVLTSIGYASEPLCDDVAFDNQRKVLANNGGRVLAKGANEVGTAAEPGLYCAGWVKRGPSGIIGTNIGDARETVAAVVEDARAGMLPAIAVAQDGVATGSSLSALRAAVVAGPGGKSEAELVSWADYEKIDAREIERAAHAGRGAPREKLTSVKEMLECI
jgi:adrenodoxin-NADP+ reductase